MNDICTQGISSETLSVWRAKLLAPSQQDPLTEHIGTCRVCQGTLAEFDRTAQVLRASPVLSSQDIVWRGVHLAITTSRGRTAATRQRLALAGLGTAVTVVTVFAILFVLLHHQMGTKPPVVTATTHLTPTLTEFALPTHISPDHIITGPDGNLWFTTRDQAQIGRMTPTGNVTLFQVPSGGVQCCIGGGRDDIVVGPDRNLWFTEGFHSGIARITTAGAITEFPLPDYRSFPQAITVGADGNLWFIASQAIGRMTLDGTMTFFPLPSNYVLNGYDAQTTAWDITSGPDGNLWFTESQGGRIGRMTTDGDLTQFPLASKYSYAWDITSGPDGNLWFTGDLQSTQIEKITTTGTITNMTLPKPAGLNKAMAWGKDGNLWLPTDFGFIERITPQGAVTPFPFATFDPKAQDLANVNIPVVITLGPDGNLWVTESAGKIGRLVP